MSMWSTGYEEENANPNYSQQTIRDGIMILEAQLKTKMFSLRTF